MLVLTRKPGEELSIGNDIVVRIIDVRGDKVSVGIVAPRSYHVLRSELTLVQGAVPEVECSPPLE